MSKRVMVSALAAMTALGACAQSSSEIAPAYVSPLQFADYSCAQIQQESQRVAAEASRAMGAQNQRAENDQAAMAVGMILFWPALFALSGDNAASESEVARLKGEMRALEQANIQRNCGIRFETVQG